MTRAIATSRQVASFEIPILLCGESGTGKSVLAASIHDWSPRRAGPFVTMMCGGHDEQHEEAWTPRAPHGTLFLDEVGMLSGPLQAKLVRFLEENASGNRGQAADASTRVIAAASDDLEHNVHAGQFRRDLFFRLNVVTIRLPALRERPEDLPRLTDEVLTSLCIRHNRPAMELAPEVRAAFAAYDWPGNMRELATVLEHAIVLARTTALQREDLPDRLLARSS